MKELKTMKKSLRKKLSVIVAAIMVLAMMPFAAGAAFADAGLTATKLVSQSGLERGVTVLPDGSIYAINSSGRVLGFSSNGSSNSFNMALPSSYCGNLCSAPDGTVFAHTYQDGGIYIFKPRTNGYKTVYAGSNCQCLATDSNGYLYSVNSAGTSAKGKKATVIYKAKISDVLALAAGSTIKWEKTYQPGYAPLASDENCYPQAIDVDSAGNIYIADKGSSNGHDVSVSGIYKYNMNTGKVSTLLFSSGNVVHMEWLYSIAADDFGNVAVVSRNGHCVAIFRNGSTVADDIVAIPGYVEDIDYDVNGDLYCNAYAKSGEEGIYKIAMNNVPLTGISLSAATKTVKVGNTATLGVTCTPSTATNKTMLFSSSNTKVATVSAKGVITGKAAGSAVITVKSMQGAFKATCKVTVVKKANPMTVRGKTARVYYSKLKKRNQTLLRSKVLAVNNAKGNVTYIKKSGKSKITIAKSTGKVTVKKGLKKGTYKVKVAVKAAGNATFKAFTKNVTFIIRVK